MKPISKPGRAPTPLRPPSHARHDSRLCLEAPPGSRLTRREPVSCSHWYRHRHGSSPWNSPMPGAVHGAATYLAPAEHHAPWESHENVTIPPGSQSILCIWLKVKLYLQCCLVPVTISLCQYQPYADSSPGLPCLICLNIGKCCLSRRPAAPAASASTSTL